MQGFLHTLEVYGLQGQSMRRSKVVTTILTPQDQGTCCAGKAAHIFVLLFQFPPAGVENHLHSTEQDSIGESATLLWGARRRNI
jgi:hypothetical protein